MKLLILFVLLVFTTGFLFSEITISLEKPVCISRNDFQNYWQADHAAGVSLKIPYRTVSFSGTLRYHYFRRKANSETDFELYFIKAAISKEIKISKYFSFSSELGLGNNFMIFLQEEWEPVRQESEIGIEIASGTALEWRRLNFSAKVAYEKIFTQKRIELIQMLFGIGVKIGKN